MLLGLMVETQPCNTLSLCAYILKSRQSENLGPSLAVKNLKIDERTSSGREDVFCHPSCGVGRRGEEYKPDESLTYQAPCNVSASPVSQTM